VRDLIERTVQHRPDLRCSTVGLDHDRVGLARNQDNDRRLVDHPIVGRIRGEPDALRRNSECRGSRPQLILRSAQADKAVTSDPGAFSSATKVSSRKQCGNGRDLRGPACARHGLFYSGRMQPQTRARCERKGGRQQCRPAPLGPARARASPGFLPEKLFEKAPRGHLDKGLRLPVCQDDHA
jgi:hypothetical protein